MDAFFPIAGDFGPEPHDCVGGPAVNDAGTIYIVRDEETPEDWPSPGLDLMVHKTSLEDLVERFLRVTTGTNGRIEELHVGSATRLRTALISAAAKLDSALG